MKHAKETKKAQSTIKKALREADSRQRVAIAGGNANLKKLRRAGTA